MDRYGLLCPKHRIIENLVKLAPRIETTSGSYKIRKKTPHDVTDFLDQDWSSFRKAYIKYMMAVYIFKTHFPSK